MDQQALTQRFSEVVQPHLADALALARWLTGSKHDAEDVVQEACLKALAGLSGFRGGNARAWVLTVVRHTAYTWMRRHRPKALLVVGDLATLDALSGVATDHTQAGGDADLIRKADARSLQSAIADLPLAFREVVVLRDINDLTYKEIAEMLSIPIGTVMSRLSRARQTLALVLTRDAR